MFQSVILIHALSVVFLLSSCGQMGPLYLPRAQDSAKVAQRSKTADKMPNDTKDAHKPVSSEQKTNKKNDQPPT